MSHDWHGMELTNMPITGASYEEQILAWATIRAYCPTDATEMARMIGLVS